MSIVRAERVDFQIAPGYFLEFYRLPSGEKRIGKTSAAVVCGFNKTYFNGLQSRSPKQLEALQRKGFDGCSIPVLVERMSKGGKGSAKAETLSLEDFRAFVRFAAFDANKKPAMAIADALMGIAVETIARQAFGEEALTLDEIRDAICKAYAKTVNWLEEDRDDARAIDQHLLFLQA